ncbi:uncharacterized protein LOC108711716 isoform X2 [Xenopus laevis]|uniref:Uncharacterized protein LOC108711716 isoform X2 n=1 Tax=Xenopus laevis TaxID=8355 RepID=A0A8J0ULH3_XENLA|nr:uncharacterized protein LOC108711716 isoform X2 [Xenopus laevis]
MHRSSGYNDRHVRELVAENSEYKKFHEQIKREVKNILSRHEGLQIRGGFEDSLGASKRTGIGRGKSSRVVDSGVTSTLKKQWSSLKQLVESLEVQAQADACHVISVTDHEKELTKLRKEMGELQEELMKSRELIGQQQQLLQEQMLPLPGEMEGSPLWDAYFLEEQLSLQQDRVAFEEQKRAFQDERDKFTEAAIRLGRERLQFKADQALFMKQQFLSMTPGIGTPPWKKTPPWSALTNDTPRGSSQKPRLNLAPHMHSPSNWQSKRIVPDPMTPSTAELYRVLRLAPPNRSALASQSKKCQKEDSDSEESKRWNDSCSPCSESPDPEVSIHNALPVKLSMTPYLHPRPTPHSLPHNRCGPKTPCTAELYRKLRLSSNDSAMSGQMKRDRKKWTPNLLNSCKQYRKYEESSLACWPENTSKIEGTPPCSRGRPRASYETDSSHSGESRNSFLGNRASPVSEKNPCPRNSSDSFERDSLYKVSCLYDSETPLSERCNQEPTRDSFCSSDGVGDTHPCLPDKDWFCEEVKRLPTSKRLSEVFHMRDNSQNPCRESVGRADDLLLSQKFEDTCTEKHNKSWSKSVHGVKDRNQSRRSHHGDHCMNLSREGSLHIDSCRRQSHEGINLYGSLRNRSSVNLYPGEDRRSHSLHRSSSKRRDSLYTSRPKCSPLHHLRSCPSEGGGEGWNSSTASHICADLLNQFLDCCS